MDAQHQDGLMKIRTFKQFEKKPKSALIIDDSELNRHILGSYLKSLGFIIHLANNGEQGLVQFKTVSPSITFLDIVMPKKSGLELLKEIKEIDKKACVIMVSSYITKHNIQQAKADGAEWFLMKPFSKEKIFEIVKQFEQRRK